MNAEMDELMGSDHAVSRDEFDEWLRNPNFVQGLKEASIDISDQTHLFDTLDADAGGFLNANELVTGLLLLRGPVTKTDVIAISLKVRYLTEMVESFERFAGVPKPAHYGHDHGKMKAEIEERHALEQLQ